MKRIETSARREGKTEAMRRRVHAELSRAYNEWTEAEGEWFKTVEALLPVETEVGWYHGNDHVTGIVREHFMGRIRIKSQSSGKLYWIDATRVLHAMTRDLTT